jgi:hypothetical protein
VNCCSAGRCGGWGADCTASFRLRPEVAVSSNAEVAGLAVAVFIACVGEDRVEGDGEGADDR